VIEMRIEEEIEKKICPRCGLRFTYIEEREKGNNVYLYVVHEYRENKRRKVRRCYLGPKSEYINVTHMHEREGVVFRGMLDYDRSIDYLKSIIDYLKNEKLDDNRRRKISEIAKSLIDIAGINMSSQGMKRIEIKGRDFRAFWIYFKERAKTKILTKEEKVLADKIFMEIVDPGEKIVSVEVPSEFMEKITKKKEKKKKKEPIEEKETKEVESYEESTNVKV
jgi:hypothetical protein